jgi:hypothetical protein
MVMHHSLNNNLWDPKHRLLNISNEAAARQFTDILLNGITKNSAKRNGKRTRQESSKNA